MPSTPEELACELEASGQGAAADRLRDLCRPDRSDAWETTNLWQVFDPGRMSAAAEDGYLRGSAGNSARRIGGWDTWRNILVLLPITFTWFSLYLATSSYRDLLQARPGRATQPFLLLWQRGFDRSGVAGWLTFSHVALIDCAMLAAVIFLTWQVQQLTGEYHGKASDTAHAKAVALREDLERVLFEQDMLLGMRRAEHTSAQFTRIAESIGEMARAVEEPLARGIEGFGRTSGELVRQLEQTRGHLETMAEREEREVASLAAFAKQLDHAAVRLGKDLPALTAALAQAGERVGVQLIAQQELVHPLAQRLELVAVGLQGLGAHAADVQHALRSSADIFARSATIGDASLLALTESARRLEDAAGAMVSASDRSTIGAGDAARAQSEGARTLIDAAGHAARAAADAHTRQQVANEALLAQLASQAEQLRTALTDHHLQLQALLDTTGGAQADVAHALGEALRQTSGPIEESARVLSAVMNGLISIGDGQRSHAELLIEGVARQEGLIAAMEDLAATLRTTQGALGRAADRGESTSTAQRETGELLAEVRDAVVAVQRAITSELWGMPDSGAVALAMAAAWREVQGDWIAALRDGTQHTHPEPQHQNGQEVRLPTPASTIAEPITTSQGRRGGLFGRDRHD